MDGLEPCLLYNVSLQIDVKRREVKSKGEKERYKRLNAEFQRIARRDKKAFSDQCKEIEENNRNGMDLTEAEDIRRGGKNTQKNCTKKIFTTKIIMMV